MSSDYTAGYLRGRQDEAAETYPQLIAAEIQQRLIASIPLHPQHQVEWSAEDGEYAATCPAHPSLSWLADGPLAALDGLAHVCPNTMVLPADVFDRFVAALDEPAKPNEALREALRRPVSTERLADLDRLPSTRWHQ